jgi:hypothetical protein
VHLHSELLLARRPWSWLGLAGPADQATAQQYCCTSSIVQALSGMQLAALDNMVIGMHNEEDHTL